MSSSQFLNAIEPVGQGENSLQSSTCQAPGQGQATFMKTFTAVLLSLCLCVNLCAGAPLERSAKKSESLPGRELAQTISLITGVAISPLLGVGAVGAWQYYQAKTPEERKKLHWYSNPAFWAPALLLVLLCFIKDTAGTALPTVLKKPLDIAETIENKISGLIAVGAFVPIAASVFEIQQGDGAFLSSLGFAAADLSPIYNGLAIALAMITFVVVFLASHAINILILLSPFTTVDAALKAFRGTVLASIVVTAWANPWLGAVWALFIILIAWLIAGWSFRLSHFGLVFIWEYISRRRNRFSVDTHSNRLFLARKVNGVPARTYGGLSRDSAGRFEFRYRPWLILPRRRMEIGPGRFELGRGAFYSEIVRMEGERARSVFLLPPRFNSHETEVVGAYQLAGIRNSGLRAAWDWLRATLATRPAASSGAGP